MENEKFYNNMTQARNYTEEEANMLEQELGIGVDEISLDEIKEAIMEKKRNTIANEGKDIIQRENFSESKVNLPEDFEEMNTTVNKTAENVVKQPVSEKPEIHTVVPVTSSHKINTAVPVTNSNIPEVVNSNKPLTRKDILDNLVIDLNEIEIVSEPTLSKVDDYDLMLNDSATYQVVCNQSYYVAFMESLKFGDITAITNSTLDEYNYRSKIYRTIYKKMQNTSLGSISYKDFLRITSFYDVQTLLFGLYQQTFPGKTEFDIKCKHCKEKSTVSIDNDSLISVKDENIYGQIQTILKSVTKPDEALKNSILSKTMRIVLPKSKVIIDIRTPSLKDHLDILGMVKPEVLEEQSQLIILMLFIKSLFMISTKDTLESGKPKYYEIKDINAISRLINDLHPDDHKYLSSKIAERMEKYQIEYKVSSFPCPKCQKEVGDIPVDMEDLLFRKIL